MPGQHNFEYAVIRIVPQVEREEFLNVGVIVYCRQHRFLQMLYTLNEERLLTFNPKAEINEIRSHLEAYKQIAEGHPDAGPIACLDIATRFRWLTAKRSTIVQSSAVHPGLCTDPQTTLDKLHQQLVLL
jgi:hypothetical protein